jgi:hypothetical protein
MRLRLFDRLRRFVRWDVWSRDAGRDPKRESRAGGHRRTAGIPPRPPQAKQPQAGLQARSMDHRPGNGAQPPLPVNYTPAGRADGRTAQAAGRVNGGRESGSRGGGGRGGVGGGVGRARVREAPFGAAPMESVAVSEVADDARAAPPRQPWYQVVGEPRAGAQVAPAALVNMPMQASPRHGSRSAGEASLPFAAPRPAGYPRAADGRTNCGPLERILWRQWDESAVPSPQAVAAIERLASFPRALQEKLAGGLDGIYVGEGGVPELDHMTELRGVPLPSGRATWDACAGAYGERKIVVGTRPSPTPDVVCHEVGHALDDLDSPPGSWQSDSPAFRLIYDQCQQFIASDFHRQRGGLGRKEFFADSFAAIASGQRPALVDMLSGNTRLALKVMLYFNRRYGI